MNFMIAIPSHNRAETHTTAGLLDVAGVDYTLVVSTDEEADAYMKAGRVGRGRMVVASGATSLVQKRNFILACLGVPGEWLVMMDDNITGWTGIPDPYASNPELPQTPDTTRLFKQPLSTFRMIEVVIESLKEADKRRAAHVGFASNENGFFRTVKYRDVGFVIGKMTATKAGSGVRYDSTVRDLEDVDMTAEQLLTNGRVLINNYLYPVKPHFAPGGIGLIDSRAANRIKDCAYLMAKFPGLLRYHDKPGYAPYSNVQVRFHSLEQVAKWRHGLGLRT